MPADAAYFHAQWRRSMTRREHPEHVDPGRRAGARDSTSAPTSPGRAFSQGWWGEGEVKFYIDGDGDFPTIADNGTEDYFGGAWGFYRTRRAGAAFSAPFLGMPLADATKPRGPRRFSLYRWHILDSSASPGPARHRPGARLVARRQYQPLTDDIASVAYWYQREPHAPFPAFPPVRPAGEDDKECHHQDTKTPRGTHKEYFSFVSWCLSGKGS